jgi:enoyl-CoA hydratase/carnithine racemase
VARAIGRHRLAWIMLGNFRVGVSQALRWGLFHAIAP